MAARTAGRAVSFETPEAPRLAQAVSLALAVMKAAKTETWETTPHLDHDPTPVITAANGLHVNLSVSQADLIAEFEDHFVVISPVSPVLSLAVCPNCQGFTMVSGTAPTKCKTTLGCEGKPVKAAIAKKVVPIPVVPLTLELTDEEVDSEEESDPGLYVHVHLHVHPDDAVDSDG